MQKLVFIGVPDKVITQIINVIPTGVNWQTLTLTEVQLAQDVDDCTILILAAQDAPTLAEQCRILKTDEKTAVSPLICLLPEPSLREEVLGAGADDYLLLPLVSSEIQLRLQPYLSPNNTFTRLFLDSLNLLSQYPRDQKCCPQYRFLRFGNLIQSSQTSQL